MSVQHTQRFALSDSEGDESITIMENADGTFDVETNFAEQVPLEALIDLFQRFLEAYEEQGVVLPERCRYPSPVPMPGIGIPYPGQPLITCKADI